MDIFELGIIDMVSVRAEEVSQVFITFEGETDFLPALAGREMGEDHLGDFRFCVHASLFDTCFCHIKYLIFLHYKGTNFFADERMFSYKNENFKFSFVNKD